jgi:hypothetical protein
MADEQKFLNDLASDNADVRFAAWRSAGEMSAATVPQLGKLSASENPGVAKAAREALTTMVHSVGKDPANPNRAAVVKGLIEIGAPSQPLQVRVHALRLLSNIAGEDAVPAIAKWLGEAAVREEAIYAVERIPGAASNKALIAAYSEAPDDFKPRVLAALGHRRVPEAAGLCAEAMRSANKDLALAGVRAYGRIGRKGTTAVRFPETKGLSPWQAIDTTDAMLRYADAQAKDGAAPEAMRVYKSVLDRPEEHWQCAAIIGLAKLGNGDAALAILPKLKSENAKVRITAENAWKSMARRTA